MNPLELGKKYDKLAQWWCEYHQGSSYGIPALKRAVGYVSGEAVCMSALDVGCGAGGRFVKYLEGEGFSITGVDVSTEMIILAQQQHPKQQFIVDDICVWETSEKFQLITAWDSIFHLPLEQHAPVITKLCQSLAPKGVLLYSFGDAEGEHTDQWRGDTFYYSSIGIRNNIQLLIDNGLTPLHIECDQFPESHMYIIALKR